MSLISCLFARRKVALKGEMWNSPIRCCFFFKGLLLPRVYLACTNWTRGFLCMHGQLLFVAKTMLHCHFIHRAAYGWMTFHRTLYTHSKLFSFKSPFCFFVFPLSYFHHVSTVRLITSNGPLRNLKTSHLQSLDDLPLPLTVPDSCVCFSHIVFSFL